MAEDWVKQLEQAVLAHAAEQARFNRDMDARHDRLEERLREIAARPDREEIADLRARLEKLEQEQEREQQEAG